MYRSYLFPAVLMWVKAKGMLQAKVRSLRLPV